MGQYRLDIYGRTVIIDGTADSGTLQFAAGGLVTEEDDNKDIFTPSRLQTATLRIIDTGGHEWRNLIPENDSQYQVRIYSDYDDADNRKVIWRGYLKSQSYSADFCDDPQEVELVAQCPLSALQSFDIQPGAYQDATFAELLIHCTRYMSLAGSPFSYFYFPDSKLEPILSCRFPWALLYDLEDDKTFKARYNCLEALEEFARFFGYTMRYCCHGSTNGLQFMASDKAVDYYAVSITELSNFIKGSTLFYETITMPTFNFDICKYFVNRGNTQEIVNGVRKVTVTADLGNQASSFSADTDMKRYFLGPVHKVDGWYGQYFSAQIRPVTFNESIAAKDYESDDFTLSFPDAVTYPETSEVWEAGDNYRIKSGAIPVHTDHYKGESSDKKVIDWKFGIQVHSCKNSEATTATTGVSLRSRHPLMIKNGYLCISANVFVWIYEVGKGMTWCELSGSKLYASLKVGDFYWNANSKKWLKEHSNFEIPISATGNDGETGEVDSNVNLIDGFMGYSGGFLIPCNATTFSTAYWNNGVRGIVELTIVGQKYGQYDTVTTFNLENLQLSYLPQYTSGQEETMSAKEYIAKNNGGYSEEKEVNLIFASNQGNILGSSILCNGVYPVSTMTLLGDTGIPEQLLANRIASYYSQGREILKLYVSLNTADGFPMSVMKVNGKNYNCIAVTRDYDNNEAELTLTEL